MKTIIIGAGAIGRAMNGIITEGSRHRAAFWDAAPGKVKGQKTLAKLLPSADAVFLCLPSSAMRKAVQSIKPYLSKRTAVVCFAKGTEEGTHLTMDRLLARILPPRQPFALLFGPMLAAELAAKSRGHATVAGDRRACRIVAEIFSGSRLAVAPCGDSRGVALCGPLKNVYAIGMGILAELGSGDNVRGAYVSIALKEMGEIVKMLGGRRETVLGFCGLADLVTTGFNKTSHNHRFGRALVKGGKSPGAEGEKAILCLAVLMRGRHKKFVIFDALHRVLLNGASPYEVPTAVHSSR
jgi:glycerol-3-phosphate dehydrogenase (NAD(P)+)